MNNIIAGGILVLIGVTVSAADAPESVRSVRSAAPAAAAVAAGNGSAGPAQVFIFADGQCRATVQPGGLDFATLFPGAQLVHKTASTRNGPIQSCEVTVAKSAVMEKFQFCALSSSSSDLCSLSYAFAGGRSVEFSAVSKAGGAAFCGFACIAR